LFLFAEHERIKHEKAVSQNKPGRFGDLISSYSRLHSVRICVVCKTWRLSWAGHWFFALCHWLFQILEKEQKWGWDLTKRIQLSQFLIVPVTLSLKGAVRLIKH